MATPGEHSLARRDSPSAAAFRDLGRRDRERTAQVLARAFRDNPLNRAVIVDDPERRLRCNRYGMRALLQSAEGAARVLGAPSRVAGGPPRAALIASDPGGYPLPTPSLRQQCSCLFGQGMRVARRWGEVYRALEAVHPREPHWYLCVLGVDPAYQGQGIGSGLLATWLAAVDRDAGFAYLETDRPENRPFYERTGFAVVNEMSVLGATVWCMARPARKAETPPDPA